MTNARHTQAHPGPVLLCAGTDPAAAAGLAEAAVALLADRRTVVLATWAPPPVMGGFDAVMDALYDSHAELRGIARRVAAEAARAACDVCEAHGLDATARVRPDAGAPWQVFLDVADRIEAGVIVAGTSERMPSQPGSLGRQARALAHRSRRPLLLLPVGGGCADLAAPAIFAYDGSLPAEHALSAGAMLLRPRPAVVASAWQSVSYAVGVALLAIPDAVAHMGAEELDDASRRQAEGRAHDGASVLAEAGWRCDTAALEHRSVAAGIIGAADVHDAAVIVTGTRGRSWMTAALLGSTAEGILRHAGRPVLLVPPAG